MLYIKHHLLKKIIEFGHYIHTFDKTYSYGKNIQCIYE
jgi:hypothetical protein